MKRSLGRKSLVAGMAFALLVAACGSDDGDGDVASNDGDVAANDAGDGEVVFSEPLVIGTLWEVKGESAVGIDDYENAAALAIDHLNEAGGVGGLPVERFRVATPVLDLQKAQSAFLEAVDKDPDVLVGFALAGQIQALSPQIARTGIPLIATTNGQPFIRFGDTDGNEYTWVAKAYDPGVVDTGINYLIDELGVENIAIMATNESNGQAGADSAKEAIANAGLEVFADAAYAPTSTDLTPQVLQMKGADAVVHIGFPNTMPVQLKQFAANDIKVPTMANDSGAIAVANGLIDGEFLDDLYVSSSCNPADPDSSPAMAEYAEKYEERYGAKPTVAGAIVYDAIFLAAQAAEIAGSTDPEAINEAMTQVERRDGVCGIYKADGAHMLNHQVMVSRYSADGTNETVKVVEVEGQEAQ